MIEDKKASPIGCFWILLYEEKKALPRFYTQVLYLNIIADGKIYMEMIIYHWKKPQTPPLFCEFLCVSQGIDFMN